jgi:haloacetate dehalogenase
MWRGVAPRLARQFTVVCADLRGYGRSGCPISTPDHTPYSKRSMARDMTAVMEHLGYPRFSVAGHDRGGRVAYRLALDHPHLVERLAALDIVPTADAWDRADARFATDFWLWSLLAQPEPVPERLLSAAPDAFVRTNTVDGALAGEWLRLQRAGRSPKTSPLICTAGGTSAPWRSSCLGTGGDQAGNPGQ